MAVETWSLIWQLVIVCACLAFFGLAAYVTRGALRDAREMFHELRNARDQNTG